MPTRLLLDGPDIEKLLDQVRTDYGQHAQIVQAERVRSGGFAGFFPKERYEVTVEIDDAYVAMSVSPEMTNTASVVDERPLALLIAEAMDQVGGDSARVDSVRENARTQPPRAAARPVEPVPTPSTSRPAFADVLGSVANGLGADPVVVHEFEKIEPPVIKQSPPTPVKTQSAVVATYGSATAESTQVVPSTVLAEIELPVKRRPTRTTQLIRDDLEVEPPKPPRGRGQVLAVVGEAGAAFDAGLELSRRMRIPQRRVMLASPDQVIPGLIASRRLTDSVTARKRSLKLLAETMPTVIAVDLPISAIWDDEAVDWASEMVGAIGAIQVWAVVDATRKYADLSRWLSKIGQVNALVVHNAAATDDLYPILDLGYPVAVLDDRPATSMVWNSMLRVSGGQNS